MGVSIFNSRFSLLNQDFDLRADSKFYVKIIQEDFKIIDKSNFPLIELRHIIFPDYEELNYEDGEIYKAFSTDSENFDEEGLITNYDEVTKENHPQRIKYKPREGDIIISSLKGAKVSAIYIDKEKTDYVWSNGFYIFRNKDPRFRSLYLFYLLRSKLIRTILDNNLSRGIGIPMYYDRDLLRLKIPLIDRTIQDKVISEIKEIESKINGIKKSIYDTQDVIEDVLERELSCSYDKELVDSKKTQVFLKKLSDISKRKFLRLDAKYYVFWNRTKGKIFNSDKVDCVNLGKLIKLSREKILWKGELDGEYLLIDKEDIDSKKGIIVNENPVNRIDSNKILFGDADILIPRLRPYLGGTFLNKKDKKLIGTPEFLPYLVDGRKIKKEYLKYLLLSKDFLSLVPYLSSGKEHPRISPYDLESIEVPLPINDSNLEKQNRIVSLIEDKLGDLNEKRRLIDELRNEIEMIIVKSLK